MTKEELRAYRGIKLERDKLRGIIKDLEAAMYNPRAQRLDGMPRSGSGARSGVESIAIRHADLLDEYRKKETELLSAMQAIEQAIESLDPTDRTVIRLYYIKGLTWEEVAVEMTYSWRQVHRIHARALKKLRAAE